MDRGEQKGSITIFLSLTCILFLCVICSAVESARIQGAKAQTANIIGMGNFSLLGEFEKPVLDAYDIFVLDGAYGSGSFGIRKVEDRFREYLQVNTRPKENVFSVWCFDPWNLELTESRVAQYALLTDEKGEPFYQQVVAFMKANSGTLALETLLSYERDTEQIRKWEEEYERRKKENDRQLSELEGQRRERMEELESELSESGAELAPIKRENPLKEIAKLRRRKLLAIVTGDRALSKKKVPGRTLPSKHRVRKGTMKLEKEHSGSVANVLFREYLMLYFPNYRSVKREGALEYQMEYLLGGRASDEQNLKYVVNRLMLLREGMNYLYCVSNREMNLQTEGLAVSLTGFLGIPALTAATKHALLLAWAYGESLIDVRSLLDGGRVPVFKNDSAWSLTLENLGRLTQILEQGRTEQKEGLGYSGYLRILLHMGTLSSQKMRALDMIQCNLQREKGTGRFKVENCIVAVRTDAEWNCNPVFFRLPRAVMGVNGSMAAIRQSGSIGY